MKNVRLAALLIIVLLSFGFQGCSKTWYVDFTRSDSLTGWKQQDWSLAPYIAEVDSKGLFVDGKILTAPVGFDGDFEMALRFSLDTSETSVVPYTYLGLTDGGDASFMAFISFQVFLIGAPVNEFYSVDEGKPDVNMSEGDAVPGLVRKGNNIYRIKKEGKNIKMSMNGEPLCDTDYTAYPAAWFFPIIYVDSGAGTGSIYFKSIRVTYEGNTTILP